MRLIERLPDIPEDQGRLWTHNTYGEHALKFSGSEHAFNPLREDYLQTLDGSPVEDIESRDFFEKMVGDNHHVILVDRHDTPRDKSGEPIGASGLIAGSIAEWDRYSRYGMTVSVAELVVHPDLRGNKIASFMLGKHTEMRMGPPSTEIIFDTRRYETPNWFLRKIIEVGFRHEDPNGSPAMWLPGVNIHTTYERDLDDPEVVNAIQRSVPTEWHGTIEVFPESNPSTEVYRNGVLVGRIRDVGGTRKFDHEFLDGIQDCELFDAGNVKIDTLKAVRDKEAKTAILNNYELLS